MKLSLAKGRQEVASLILLGKGLVPMLPMAFCVPLFLKNEFAPL
jgi:hypothetical protein